MLPALVHTNRVQKALRLLLGGLMVFAGVAHLTFARAEFQAQVPTWVPAKDLVVVLSGLVEVSLGMAMVLWRRRRVYVGLVLAAFYILIFPGNLAQYFNHTTAFGLGTDHERLMRLFFQPVLVAWALWSTGAGRAWRQRRR